VLAKDVYLTKFFICTCTHLALFIFPQSVNTPNLPFIKAFHLKFFTSVTRNLFNIILSQWTTEQTRLSFLRAGWSNLFIFEFLSDNKW